jgi:hypothetical protein
MYSLVGLPLGIINQIHEEIEQIEERKIPVKE